MVKKLKKSKSLKRCIPLLLALVFIISCLPVIPAAAVYALTGTWKFSDTLDPQWSVMEDVVFTSYGRTFGTMEFEGGKRHDESKIFQ